MKRIIIILNIFSACLGSLYAQEPRFIFDNDSLNQELNATLPADLPTAQLPAGGTALSDSLSGDSMNRVLPEIPSWRIDPRFGERIPVPMDTLFKGYHQESLMDGQGVAVGYLGNWGSPAQSKIFFERGEASHFNFLDAFSYYHHTPANHTFLDTKNPYSNFTYHSGGGRQSKEEYFTGTMSLSFNKNFTLGFDIDYIYSRGFYRFLSNKQTNYSVFASYITDKYKMHAIFIQNNYMNIENGGLTTDPTRIDPNSITDPDATYLSETLAAGYLNSTEATAIRTNYGSTWNKLRGRQFYMNHKYSIGYNEQTTENFIPVASVIWSSHYADQKRTFTSAETSTLDRYYNYYLVEENLNTIPGSENSTTNTSDQINDRMSYYSFKNTFAISLNEGFREWVKFGLTGFIENDMRKFTTPGLTFTSLTTDEYSQNSTIIGGQLSKRQGRFLRYNLYADLGILGDNQGETRINADITTQFKLFNRDVIVKGQAYLKTLKPVFYEKNYFSRYYNWTDDQGKIDKYHENNTDPKLIDKKEFNNIKRTFIGGELLIPSTKTRLSGGVENLEDYIYYWKQDDYSKVEIKQANEKIQVLALRLDQKLSLGVLHFDNQVVYQKVINSDSPDNVIPLPEISLYSNLYLQFKVARVLDVQFGLDAHYHSKYFAPGYDPALLQFYNQKQREIGEFPISTIYANFHLKKTRFFVMMYNVGSKITDTNYYVLDRYAINPMVFKFGLSWNFTN